MSGLNWIQTVWYSDGTPKEFFFEKKQPKKNQQMTKEHVKFPKTCGDKQVTVVVFLFDLILYVPSTIFQSNRDESSWVEPVLS